MPKILPVVVSVCSLSVLAGCGTNSQTVSPTENDADVGMSGLDLSADVRAEESVVVLPADRFMVNDWEANVVSTAASMAISVCAREELGIERYVPPTAESPSTESLMFAEFGPWTATMADSFGFVMPMTQGELSANGIIDPPVTEAEVDQIFSEHALSDSDLQRVIDECGEGSQINTDFERFADYHRNLYVGAWNDEFIAAENDVLADPRTVRVRDELMTCYEDKGLAVSAQPDDGYEREGALELYIEGLDSFVIDETQVTMANKVVECKQETQAIETISAIWAEKQAPVIEKYADELVAYRAEADAAIVEANQYVQEHSDLLMPEVQLKW